LGGTSDQFHLFSKSVTGDATLAVTTLPAPTAWYPLDGSASAPDASGNSRTGTLAACPSWTTGESGGAMTFNGATQYVTLPALNLNSNTVTISGWIKRNGTPSSYTGVVFYRNGSGTASGISLRSSGVLTYNWNDNYSAYNWSSGLTLPNGVWTFVALVITSSNATMYMQPAGSAMQSAVNSVSNAAQAFSGVSYLGQDSLGGRFYNGSLDDVRIYNSSLSRAQVTQLADSYFPPTVNTAASASPATVSAATTTLSVAGSSSASLPLTYSWSSSGPGTVTFSPNGTNAAKNTTATFSKAGSYTLSTTIADTYGQFTTSSVNVTVNQTITSIAVALTANNLATTGAEQFGATLDDQFGQPMASQPSFTWSVVGGGTLSASGNYQPPYATGSAVISATASGFTGQTTATYPGIAQWNSAGGGSWSSGSWIGTTSLATVSAPGLRGVTGDEAQFATGGGTISLSGAAPTLAGVFFASASAHTLSGGALTLANGASSATITVTAGAHTMTTPLTHLLGFA
jgi:hypothetical protein